MTYSKIQNYLLTFVIIKNLFEIQLNKKNVLLYIKKIEKDLQKSQISTIACTAVFNY